MSEIEQWKEIDGFNGHYQISSFGKVKSNARKTYHGVSKGWQSIPERILSQKINKYGYSTVHLFYEKGFAKTVHRLVAIAFIPNIENKREVNHINGIKTDNRLENLEWATSSENKIHAIINGLGGHKKGKENKVSKLMINQVTGEIKTSMEVAEEYGVSQAHVYKMVTGIRTNKTNYVRI